MTVTERLLWRPVAKVQKYDYDTLDRLGLLGVDGTALRAEGVLPYEERISEGNLLMNAGINRMIALLLGAGGQAFTNPFTRLGVGDGTAAAVATQTDLQGANKFYRTADAGFPNGNTAQTITIQATYDTNTANFAWNEWAIDQGGGGTNTSGTAVGAPLLNRKVPSPSLGTKTSGSWVLTTTIVLS